MADDFPKEDDSDDDRHAHNWKSGQKPNKAGKPKKSTQPKLDEFGVALAGAGNRTRPTNNQLLVSFLGWVGSTAAQLSEKDIFWILRLGEFVMHESFPRFCSIKPIFGGITIRFRLRTTLPCPMRQRLVLASLLVFSRYMSVHDTVL